MSENARPLNEGSDADRTQWLAAGLRALAAADPILFGPRANELRESADQLESLQSRCRALEAQLTEHRVFTHYIAKRYEEGWDEPVTERFYLRAMAALAVPPTGEPQEPV